MRAGVPLHLRGSTWKPSPITTDHTMWSTNLTEVSVSSSAKTNSPEYPTIWIFDDNCRIYAPAAPGRLYGELIWIKHWCRLTVTGQTKQSWVTDRDGKIPKKNTPAKYQFSWSASVDLAYREDNARQIAQAVRDCLDVSVLKQIAALVRHTPKPVDYTEPK